jgi:hypothetical protein
MSYVATVKPLFIAQATPSWGGDALPAHDIKLRPGVGGADQRESTMSDGSLLNLCLLSFLFGLRHGLDVDNHGVMDGVFGGYFAEGGKG